MSKKYLIGIDLGGTKISGAISDLNGKVVYKKTVDTLTIEGPVKVAERITSLIKYIIGHINALSDEVAGIGIASPGPLDIEKGIIIKTANLPFKDYPLIEFIESGTGIKGYLENDANAAALGELQFGAGKGFRNFIYITVSTGIGGGIVINGDIYHGNTGNAGEFGHTTINPDGEKCNCGNYGCWETTSSGTAIARIANERLKNDMSSILHGFEKVTSKEVFESAALGDKLSAEVIDYCTGFLGIGVANLVNIFDPELVIIGGGVAKAGNILFERVKKEISKRCLRTMADSVKIVPAALGTDAGVYGALAVAMSKCNIQYISNGPASF